MKLRDDAGNVSNQLRELVHDPPVAAKPSDVGCSPRFLKGTEHLLHFSNQGVFPLKEIV